MVRASSYEKEVILKLVQQSMVTNFNPQSQRIGDKEQMANFLNLVWDTLCDNGFMHIGKTRLPDIRWFGGWSIWPTIYADSMMIHHLMDDDYSEKNVSMIEDFGGEGPYSFEDMIVEPGDVVIDAGAFIGDWSAVAAVNGGNVFAFDPCPIYANILMNTASWNSFEPVLLGLGDEECVKRMDLTRETGGETGAAKIADNGVVEVKLTTVDTFRKERDLKIDYIKADIEGFERYMLKGAYSTLKEDEPKLAIRTYHFREDRFLLPKLILNANPRYKIISRRNTLYAYVPR